MDIFEKLLNDLLKHEIHNFKSWLYTYSRNFCLMKLRKKSKEIAMSEIENNPSEVMELEENIHQSIEKETQLQQLEKAIENLNNEQKKCISLFYLHEKSYIDIVNETGYELKKVKSYIQNGKRNLMIQLSKNNATIVVLLLLFKLSIEQ